MSDVPPVPANENGRSFLARHEFLLRRLHSLSGLVPVGAYMVVHLAVNSLATFSPVMYQRQVNNIHDLGPLLWIVEWAFIFIPLIFHAVYGVLIVRGAEMNTGRYKYGANRRFQLQRITGMIAFFFIFLHVFHMHGWFHVDGWLKVVEGLGGHMFRPFNAASSGSDALRVSPIVWIGYLVGIFACVFHLANGIWTAGITWGLWITPPAQKRALQACTGFGALVLAIGLTAWTGFAFTIDPVKAKQEEDKITNARIAAGELTEEEAAHKRTAEHHDAKTADAAAESAGS